MLASDRPPKPRATTTSHMTYCRITFCGAAVTPAASLVALVFAASAGASMSTDAASHRMVPVRVRLAHRSWFTIPGGKAWQLNRSYNVNSRLVGPLQLLSYTSMVEQATILDRASLAKMVEVSTTITTQDRSTYK